MATLFIEVPAGSWKPTGSDVESAVLDQGTAVGGSPVHTFWRWKFDASAANIYLVSDGIRIPSDYVGSPVFKLDWMVDDTNAAHTAGFAVGVLALASHEQILANNTQSSQDGASSGDTAHTTANTLLQASITMSSTTIAANDLVYFCIKAIASGQDVTNPPYFLCGLFEYSNA